MQDFFQLNALRASILSFMFSGNPWIGSGDQPEKDKHARDITFLDKYSMERWEVAIHKPVDNLPVT